MLSYLVWSIPFCVVVCAIYLFYRKGSKAGRNKTLLEIHELHDKTVKEHAVKLDKSLNSLSKLRTKLNKLPKGSLNTNKISKAKKT